MWKWMVFLLACGDSAARSDGGAVRDSGGLRDGDVRVDGASVEDSGGRDAARPDAGDCAVPDGSDPAIGCVIGAVRDGSSVVIAGARFGAVGPNVVIFDDFEGGSPGDPIATGAGSAAVGEWVLLGSGTPRYGDEFAVSGSRAFRADFSEDSNQQAFADLPPDTTEIFYSWWMYTPEGHRFPGQDNVDTLNWKVIWLLGEDRLGGGTHDDDLFFAFLQPDDAPTAVFGGNCSVYTEGSRWPTVDLRRGRWKRISIWDRGRTDATGALRIWELRDDGPELHVDDRDMQTLPTDCGAAPHRWERVSFNGYGRSTEAPSNQYLDDFYVAVGPDHHDDPSRHVRPGRRRVRLRVRRRRAQQRKRLPDPLRVTPVTRSRCAVTMAGHERPPDGHLRERHPPDGCAPQLVDLAEGRLRAVLGAHLGGAGSAAGAPRLLR
jgi:hypothetical protein